MQMLCAEALIFPSAHRTQESAIAALYFPASQLLHAYAPTREYVPLRQSTQMTKLYPEAYFPAVHEVQLIEASAALKAPERQLLQLVCATASW